MSTKVLSFGELLLRISPDGDGHWLRDNTMPFYVGGAEANVATALALWEVESAYCTALPENYFSRDLAGYLAGKNIDVSRILYCGNRIGLYYLPKGKDLKNAGVIYDRAHSSFWDLKAGQIDWDKVFEGIGWLHLTAISPALNADAAAVCEEAARVAASRGIKVSIDLNYRAKLWQYGVAPDQVMPEIVAHCEVVMGNLWAAEKMLGVAVDGTIGAATDKAGYLAHAQRTSEAILQRFPSVKAVANTFRFDKGASGIQYYTALYAGGELYTSREYVSDAIVDKVGSGDCYMAGLIYGMTQGLGSRGTVEFATAAAFQKLFITSDATNQKAAEIEKFISSYEG